MRFEFDSKVRRSEHDPIYSPPALNPIKYNMDPSPNESDPNTIRFGNDPLRIRSDLHPVQSGRIHAYCSQTNLHGQISSDTFPRTNFL